MMRRWNPVSDMMTLRDAMNQLLEESFVRPWGMTTGYGEMGMPIDMYEQDNTLIVKTSMPGVRPEDIDVKIEGDTLTITGEIESEQEQMPQAQPQMQQTSQTQPSKSGQNQGRQMQTASANQQIMQSTGRQNWYMREHRYGRFVRTVTLPYPAQTDQAEATIANGMLTLRLPKAEQARAKQIKVKSDGH